MLILNTSLILISKLVLIVKRLLIPDLILIFIFVLTLLSILNFTIMRQAAFSSADRGPLVYTIFRAMDTGTLEWREELGIVVLYGIWT